MKHTFNSFSLGCRVNQAEKEDLDRQLIQLGYSHDSDGPELFIINSCSVTGKAEREVKQLIYQTRRKNPSVKIIVTGCAATNWLKTKTNIPQIDLLVDNQNKEYLALLIQKKFGSGRKTNLNTELEDKFINSGRLILKIQDGCHRFCTYCIVPYLRGLPKSIPVNQLIKTINSYDNKIKEVILTAINTEAYGYDNKETFISLIEKVLAKTKTERISFGSINPWSVDETFINLYKNNKESGRIVNFFHIPLQSGSDKMLNLMKRGYTRAEFIDKLNILGSIRPYTFIGTDVIVGYLEETDKDFQDTYEFLEKTPISKFHIFRFSKREHTAANYLAKKLIEPNAQTKIKRAKTLAELGKRKYESFLNKHVGETFSALFLENKKGEYQECLLNNQIPVLVKSKNKNTGTIKNVRIIQYKNGRLFGRIT